MHAKRLLGLGLAAAGLVALVGAPAAAFNVFSLDGGRSIVSWPSLPVSFEINDSFIPGMSNDQAVIQAAFDTWSEPDCSGWRSNYTGTTSSSSSLFIEGNNDQRNRVVYVSANRWPVTANNALAVTQSSYRGNNQGWITQEADIAFNGGVSWSSNPSGRQFDLQSVATHEIGHLLGLQHTPISTATMYFSTGPSDRTQQSLHGDDERAVCYLYPAGGTHTCSSAQDCPTVDGQDDLGRDVTYGQMGCGTNGVCSFNTDVGPGSGQGGPCQSTENCEDNLICVTYGNESFCTENCNTQNNTTCPSSYTCGGFQNATDGSGACIPGESGGGNGGYLDACNSFRECTSELCLLSGEGDDAFCSEWCNTSDGSGCVSGSSCVPLQGESRGGCIPGGDAAPGTVCDSPSDCPDGLCLQGPDNQFRCREACDFGLSARCASTTSCLLTEQGGACFESGALPLGSACSSVWDCQSLLCIDSVCIDLCDGSCPSGFACQDVGGGYQGCVPDEGTTNTSNGTTNTSNGTTNTSNSTSNTSNGTTDSGGLIGGDDTSGGGGLLGGNDSNGGLLGGGGDGGGAGLLPPSDNSDNDADGNSAPSCSVPQQNPTTPMWLAFGALLALVLLRKR